MLKFIFLFVCLLAQLARADEEPVRILVLEFQSKGGVTPEQMDALADLVQTEIRKLGDLEVLAKGDITSLAKYDEYQALFGRCQDDACFSRLGALLGARWVVVGNVSWFGKTFLLNIKVLDSKNSRLQQSVSRTVKGGQDRLLSEVPDAVRELLAGIASWNKAATGDAATSVAEKAAPDKQPPALNWGISLRGLFFGGMAGGKEVTLYSGSTFEAGGDMNGDRLGLGLRAAAAFDGWHSVFLQVDYLVEHWLGGAWYLQGSDREWDLGVDFPVVRGRAGYGFSWPVLSWLAPYAEAALGLQATLGRKVTLRDTDGQPLADLDLLPEKWLRFVLTLELGLEARFSRFSAGAGYLWDIPLYQKSSNAVVVYSGMSF